MLGPSPSGKPWAIISDIDDSLDLFGGQPNMRVIRYLRSAFAEGYKIIVLTNRSALRQNQTLRWLAYWGVPVSKLLMRPVSEIRDSARFKTRAYREDIAPLYEVKVAIDNLREPWTTLKVPLWLIQEGSDNSKISARYNGVPRRRPAGARR